MVAVLKPNKSLRATFYYNENKLKAGKAVCLLAENYPRQLAGLSEADKLQMLLKMAAIKPRLKVNSLHISLNFDPSETLSEQRLRAIARDYMQEIGFGNQPYLVYQHFDAAHPHIHLATTNIQADGRPISLHYLGIRASEPARKMIEKKYNLVQAEQQGAQEYGLRPAVLAKAIYGRSQTKKAIGNVLLGVLDSYKFSSLEELNAVLSRYNVRAERGSESSRIYRHRGLVYRLLDEHGAVAGVPVKASAYYQKPGLDYLEQRFSRNVPLKRPYQVRVKNAVDLALLKPHSLSLGSFSAALKKQGIDLVLRQNTGGQVYGITYVDHQTKCVFNGSELGKSYSAKVILERTTPARLTNIRSVSPELTVAAMKKRRKDAGPGSEPFPGTLNPFQLPSATRSDGLIEQLFQPENTWEPDPYDLTRRRKKRRRKTNIKPQ